MRKTTNYELNIAEGSDRYNHLTIDNPNYEKIDTTMKENEDSAVQTATELKSGTVHAITRNKPNASMFRFVATSDFTSGETFTVDGQQVTALLPNGATLGTGAYHINANVLCCLVGTNMTVYTIGVAENVDASTLEGHGADYFATADALNDVRQTATSAGVVANAANTTANNAMQAVNGKNIVVFKSDYHNYNDTPGSANFTTQIKDDDMVLITVYLVDNNGNRIINSAVTKCNTTVNVYVSWFNETFTRKVTISTNKIEWGSSSVPTAFNIYSVIKL